MVIPFLFYSFEVVKLLKFSSMELDEFIKNVIVNIHNGISNARTEIGKDVLPTGGLTSSDLSYVKSGTGPTVPVTFVSNLQFEVALTEGAKDGSKAGIGVLLGALSLGGTVNSESENTSLSKIKFNIPIKLE